MVTPLLCYQQSAWTVVSIVLLTLLALLLIGFLLTLFIIVGGRWVRRQARWNQRSTVFGGSAKKPPKDPQRVPGLPGRSGRPGQDAISAAETRIDNGSEETQPSHE